MAVEEEEDVPLTCSSMTVFDTLYPWRGAWSALCFKQVCVEGNQPELQAASWWQ